MATVQAIAEARLSLGRQLAAARGVAGMAQAELARRINYHRSSVANVETGRQNAPQEFWLACDVVLGTGSALTNAYDELDALISQHRKVTLTHAQRDRRAQLARVCETAGAVWPYEGQLPVVSAAGAATVMLSVRLDGREVTVALDRRVLLQAGVGIVLDAFAVGPQVGVAVHNAADTFPKPGRVAVTSPAQVEEILNHMREQWHALVKTDNLLGPRYALAGVLNEVAIIEGLMLSLREKPRREAVRLGARYAESAAWLYEDAGDLARARYWTSRAMEWAHEANDQCMLAWTIFRRSQQAAATREAAQVIGLAQAARRDEEQLATPTRAAIRVQEAYGYALDGDEVAAQKLIDDAHAWAASDNIGDARGGHGSYCTPSYVEIQRANCWLASGKPKKAIALYEDSLRRLPPVYQRNHAAALSWLAAAYVADGQVEQAARTAHAALPVARSSGSRRTLMDIRGIGAKVAPNRSVQAVAALLGDLAGEDADVRIQREPWVGQ